MFGGTFDPIHRGHLHLVSELVKLNRFDEIWVVPSGQPQLRDEPGAKPSDRMAMVEIALGEVPSVIARHVIVSDIDVERIGPSYAIDTVEELMAENPGEWTFVIGSDNVGTLPQWHRFSDLAERVNFLVIQRPGATASLIDGVRMESLEIDALDISATVIREALAEGVSVEEFITPEVAEYIDEHGLYARK